MNLLYDAKTLLLLSYFLEVIRVFIMFGVMDNPRKEEKSPIQEELLVIGKVGSINPPEKFIYSPIGSSKPQKNFGYSKKIIKLMVFYFKFIPH